MVEATLSRAEATRRATRRVATSQILEPRVAPKPALALVPGLGADAGDWPHQIDHLADVADVTVADVAPCASRAEIAEAVLRAAPGLFAPGGHSVGGWAAQEAAARARRGDAACPPQDLGAPQRRGHRGTAAGNRDDRPGRFEEFLDENLPGIVHPDRARDGGCSPPYGRCGAAPGQMSFPATCCVYQGLVPR
jgi:hypothetical protein